MKELRFKMVAVSAATDEQNPKFFPYGIRYFSDIKYDESPQGWQDRRYDHNEFREEQWFR